RNDVGAATFPRHGTKTMSGQRRFPDMAQNRCRGSDISPTWHENDVGAEAFPRHGTKPMSGQRRFPDMARNRCRDRGVPPTWHKTDVGPEVFPRHGIKTMSGRAAKTANKHKTTGNSNDFRWFLINLIYALL